jgi:hypothetical protein
LRSEQLGDAGGIGNPAYLCDGSGRSICVNGSSCEDGTVPPLGGVETAMDAFSCPMCLRALKISTIEPHPIRDRADVMTYRCPIHGDIWKSVIANRVEAADTDREAAATMM